MVIPKARNLSFLDEIADLEYAHKLFIISILCGKKCALNSSFNEI